MSTRGIVGAEIWRSEQFEYGERTSDPASPAVGDTWIRGDIQPTNKSVAALRIQGSGGVLEVPIFDDSVDGSLGADVYVGRRYVFDDGSVGYLLVTDKGGAKGSPRLVTSSGTEFEAHDALTLAIPDNTIARYNSQLGFSASDEGGSITTWPDETGTYNISTNGGNALVTGSGINGNRSLDVRGDNVEFQLTSKTLNPPYSIICVIEYTASDTSTFAVPFDRGDTNSGSNRAQISQGVSSGKNKIRGKKNGSAAGFTVNSTKRKPVIYSARFDGNNSLGRVAADGATSVVEASGTTNSPDLVGWTLGSADGVAYYEGYLGAYLIVDAGLSSSEFANQESRLASDWTFSGGWV